MASHGLLNVFQNLNPVCTCFGCIFFRFGYRVSKIE